MILFPISKSFLQRDAIARVIENEYALTNVACQLISTTLRDVYRIDSTQGHSILYIYQTGHRSLDEISTEWRFVDYLFGAGVPVAPAVRKKSGDLILTFAAPEGIRFGVLTHFAEGVILRKRSSPGAVRAYGQIVATIHFHADLMPFTLGRSQIDFSALIQQSVRVFEREISDRPKDLAFLCESAQVLQEKISVLSKEDQSFGMIHGDVIRTNALVADDGQITIIDFDFCGYGWRAYDIASYLITIRNSPDEEKFSHAFLEGYDDIRPLGTQEKETLALFEAIRAIVSIGTPAMNIQHWGSSYFYAFVDHDLAALRAAMERVC